RCDVKKGGLAAALLLATEALPSACFRLYRRIGITIALIVVAPTEDRSSPLRKLLEPLGTGNQPATRPPSDAGARARCRTVLLRQRPRTSSNCPAVRRRAGKWWPVRCRRSGRRAPAGGRAEAAARRCRTVRRRRISSGG